MRRPPPGEPARRVAVAPGLRGLRNEVRARLLAACALEREPPGRTGFDFVRATRLFTITCALYRWYFRTTCFGIEQIPRGPVMLVANHGSHALSWDGANVVSACLLEAEPPRLARGMAHHRLMNLPIIGRSARSIGAVDGRPEECTRLLRAGASVLVFPEGTRAHERRFRNRYRLAPFGQGFVRIAIATRTPIVPVAVIGAEEEAPLLWNPRWLQRLVRTPVAPITPTLFVPLPVHYRLHFGAPHRLAGPATPAAVSHGVEEIRTALGALIEDGLASRLGVFR
jgi:1-acyl-sn-glycerol-3-phosphate acyltransferase